MFETTAVISRKRPRRTSFLQAFPVTAIVHAAGVGGLVLAHTWSVDFPRHAPAQIVAFVMADAIAAPPPPPPPPPPPQAQTEIVKVETEQIVPRDLEVAPSFIPLNIPDLTPAPVVVSEAAVAGGVEGGVIGGQLGGVIGGLVGGVIDSRVPPESQLNNRVVIALDHRLPLQPVSQVFPEYPELARMTGLEGRVVVRYTIDKRGRVSEVVILRHASHRLFDEAVVHAIRQWRFRPMKRNGEPVEVVHDLTINFVLEQES